MSDSEKIKAFDLGSTLSEIMITLASAIIVGLITFHRSVVAAGVKASAIEVVLIFMAVSIVFGFLTIGGMAHILEDDEISTTLFNKKLGLLWITQWTAYVLGLLYLICSVL